MYDGVEAFTKTDNCNTNNWWGNTGDYTEVEIDLNNLPCPGCTDGVARNFYNKAKADTIPTSCIYVYIIK